MLNYRYFYLFCRKGMFDVHMKLVARLNGLAPTINPNKLMSQSCISEIPHSSSATFL